MGFLEAERHKRLIYLMREVRAYPEPLHLRDYPHIARNVHQNICGTRVIRQQPPIPRQVDRSLCVFFKCAKECNVFTDRQRCVGTLVPLQGWFLCGLVLSL